MEELKKRILVLFSIIVAALSFAFMLRLYIENQTPLKIEQLDDIVEKEIMEIYGKN
jgi:hypothetical protein